jgi:hypothetical protein
MSDPHPIKIQGALDPLSSGIGTLHFTVHVHEIEFGQQTRICMFIDGSQEDYIANPNVELWPKHTGDGPPLRSPPWPPSRNLAVV